jgi:hypothetical protein
VRLRASTIAAACLFLLCALSPSAAAAPGNLFGETGLQDEFSLGKAPHTVLHMSTSGQRVTLTVSRGAQSVGYEVPGTVSEDRVKAKFGRAGKVDVRFKPSGPPQSVEPFPFCKGKDGSVSAGAFVGSIRFTGFDRFVHFHASRVKGNESRTPPMHCHLPGSGHVRQAHEEEAEREEGEGSVVLAAGLPCKSRLVFLAAADENRLDPASVFAAVSTEKVGRVSVSRLVLLFDRHRGLFTFDSGLTSATTSPPPPFHGSATFQRGAEGAPSTWSGSLSVSFLDGRQALTGDGIEAALEAVAPGDEPAAVSECDSGHAQTSALSIP